MNSAIAGVFGITHVDISTPNLSRALRLYGELLGFAESARGAGWVDLDAGGALTLRLRQTPSVERRVTLRLRVAIVQTCVDALVSHGCSLVSAAEKTPELTLAATVRDEDGHWICVWRPLSEDEYDVTPELPKGASWTKDAEVLLKQLLNGVPALFRSLARRKVTRVAETLARAGCSVETEDVIRGFILSSPRITRERNRKPLVDAGIDVAKYQADWDSP